MNPVVSYIKQTLQGYYPDSELVPMAKLLLTQVFGKMCIRDSSYTFCCRPDDTEYSAGSVYYRKLDLLDGA